MKILIAGFPDSGQREIAQLLTKSVPEGPLTGLVLEHHFKTKYFDATGTLWIDEIDELDDWVDEFCSDEAREVRDALTLFIYTFKPGSPPAGLQGLAKFNDLLKPGTSLAVPLDGAADKKTHAEVEQAGFDVVDPTEVEPAVHSAIYDAQAGSDEEEDASGPQRDIDEIIEELVAAKNSSSMTDEQKRALAERLAGELL